MRIVWAISDPNPRHPKIRIASRTVVTHAFALVTHAFARAAFTLTLGPIKVGTAVEVKAMSGRTAVTVKVGTVRMGRTLSGIGRSASAFSC